MMGKFKQSLEDWMINNLGVDSIEKYWSDKNEINPSEIGYCSHKKVWIICQEKGYHGDYEIMASKFSNNRRCPYCRGLKVHPKDSFAQWGINNLGENFLEKYWSIKNDISPCEITKSSHKAIWIKCQIKDYHDDYETRPDYFIGLNQRCPYCNNKGEKLHQNDSLGELHPEAFLLWSNKNNKSPFQFPPNTHITVWWKCPDGKHDDFNRKISASNTYNFRCPQCIHDKKESILQEKVRLLLTNELNYKVNHENNCEIKCINPKTNYKLPYDNEVIINNNRLIIEVHGEQHYKTAGYNTLLAKAKGTSPQEELEYLQRKDQYKEDYAILQRYYYLAIPYWTDNEQEEWKDLIINKLSEIESNK